MKICDSCGTVGGGHTAFCRYKNSDPTMLDIHSSHRVLPNAKECVNCKRSDVVGLTLECKMLQPVESFVIHPSHRLTPKAGVPVKCELCEATSREQLEKICLNQPFPVETANQIRDRLKPSPSELKRDFVWMIYDYNHSAYVISIHNTPEDAIEKHSSLGHGRIGQWEIGIEFHDAVKKWESRDE